MQSMIFSDELIWQMPGHLLIKDAKSKYIKGNKETIRLLGFNKLDHLVGNTDHELRCDAARFAHHFIQEDAWVVKNKVGLSCLYILKYADNNIHVLQANKIPLIDTNTTDVDAVICQGFYLHNKNMVGILNKLIQIDGKFKNDDDSLLGCYYINKSENDIRLTKKQNLCLFYLLRGKSAKEIAECIFISPRTVETHINAIKIKFGCNSKSELIEKAIYLGYLSNLPFDISTQYLNF